MTTTIHRSIDIETGALPIEEIAHLKPAFAAPANYKDPEKIAAYITQQEIEWIQKAALSPLTGRVLVIGIKEFRLPSCIILEGDEKSMLRSLWELVADRGRYDDQWFGHNIGFFDIPFLVKRSWLHGVPVPLASIFDDRGFLKSHRFRDTMTAFQCGNRNEFISLDTVGKFLGLGGKENANSANFAALYAQDRAAAIAHLCRDLELVEGVASRMFSLEAVAA